MSGHTLGPWKVAPAREGIIDIFDANDHDVVTLYGGRMGNAQLIAASPELLAALRKAAQLAEIASDWNLEEVEIDGEMVRTRDLREQFNAAIAKADGQS